MYQHSSLFLLSALTDYNKEEITYEIGDISLNSQLLAQP